MFPVLMNSLELGINVKEFTNSENTIPFENFSHHNPKITLPIQNKMHDFYYKCLDVCHILLSTTDTFLKTDKYSSTH